MFLGVFIQDHFYFQKMYMYYLYSLNFCKIFDTQKKIPEAGDELTITLAIINQSTFSLSRLKSNSISDVCLEVKIGNINSLRNCVEQNYKEYLLITCILLGFLHFFVHFLDLLLQFYKILFFYLSTIQQKNHNFIFLFPSHSLVHLRPVHQSRCS